MDLSPACLTNHRLYASTEYLSPKFFGGQELPPGWVEHHGCDYCKCMKLYIVDKHALHPDNNKHPRSAESGTEYAFTLTMPPDHQPAIPLPEVAKKILEYGLTNKPYEKATKWAYVLEHTEKGTPHIHGVYQTESGRRLSSKYFKRYWPLWDEKVILGHGHKGGYHQKARHTESYAAYLEKEGAVIKSNPIENAAHDQEASSPPSSPSP